MASLADYNAGRLHGVWIEATQPPSRIWAEIREMLARSPEPMAEEWAIHDFEGFAGLRLDEHEAIEDVAALARRVAPAAGPGEP